MDFEGGEGGHLGGGKGSPRRRRQPSRKGMVSQANSWRVVIEERVELGHEMREREKQGLGGCWLGGGTLAHGPLSLKGSANSFCFGTTQLPSRLCS